MAEKLAPKSYAAAEKSYLTARKHSEAGRQDSATKHLVKANGYLRQAIESVLIADARKEERTVILSRGLEHPGPLYGHRPCRRGRAAGAGSCRRVTGADQQAQAP